MTGVMRPAAASGIATAGTVYVFVDWMRRFFMPLRDLSAKDKCFALATEVALVTGLSAERTLLPRLVKTLAPDEAEAAIATFAAKYA